MLIGGFQPFTLTDFPGRSAAIVFTSGCNFRCPWCHNSALIGHGGSSGGERKVFSALERRRGLLDGVVVTGGEPTIHEDLPAFISSLRGMGFQVKLDTNGSRPGMIGRLLEAGALDYIAMDVKAPPGKYSALCGLPVDLNAVSESIRTIGASGVEHEFRTTSVPGLLDGSDLMAVMAMIPEGSPHRIQDYRTPPGPAVKRSAGSGGDQGWTTELCSKTGGYSARG